MYFLLVEGLAVRHFLLEGAHLILQTLHPIVFLPLHGDLYLLPALVDVLHLRPPRPRLITAHYNTEMKLSKL